MSKREDKVIRLGAQVLLCLRELRTNPVRLRISQLQPGNFFFIILALRLPLHARSLFTMYNHMVVVSPRLSQWSPSHKSRLPCPNHTKLSVSFSREIMYRNRCWPTTFHNIVTEDVD